MVVSMEVQHVEVARPLPHFLQHQHVVRERVANLRIETQASFAACHELRRRFRVAACEQCNLVTLAYQFFGEVGNDPFSPPSPYSLGGTGSIRGATCAIRTTTSRSVSYSSMSPRYG
jgi:hypothetical protein